MNRIVQLKRRYAASAALVKTGVEVLAVGDPAGARLNALARQLLVAVRDDGHELWEDLTGATKALRWRRVTQPQPIHLNSALVGGAAELRRQVRRMRGAVTDEALLDQLAEAAMAVGETDSPVGDVLLRSIEEIGAANCVVVAANRTAQSGLADWLREWGVAVVTVADLEREFPSADQAYVVGPPCFFRSSLVTAPVTSGVSFLIPAWFGDRTIPRSALAAHADGAILVNAKVFTEGDTSEPEVDAAAAEVEDEFLPQPSWGSRCEAEREPTADEVEARKVLLSGDLAIWLDDGDRIRALDTAQPPGERVVYTDVNAVRPGTYLLLRRGETERGVLYRSALNRLSSKEASINAAQVAWKHALAQRLADLGYRRTVVELRAAGVKTAHRAKAWIDPNLVRPNRDEDFESLLRWLGVAVQPTFRYATMLRRALHQASAELREQLERAVSAADLSLLEREGHWFLGSQREGVRGLTATRVLAISPYTEIVPRHDARVPFEDRSGQWLE
ncbi:hypothetical protein FNH05_13195 [Amycolatopsis rhizosphaerae]|uniref:Uncharacterized protein n=1 Tax=Amycolatopsis rhizosphaerae TaxID=2053003 RepID=A0A558CU35_9PSEU|nr:hypothetical protein [Amycolatopsis rhizosphaerae]TVT52289.1 hypothetical protein FNH05_13195 [Amycolatopsis rhizosphaerae]